MKTGTVTRKGAVEKSTARILPAVFVFALMLLMVLSCFSVRPDLHWRDWTEQSKQYEKLAVSLSEGYTWLDDEVPVSLLEMDDPYNYGERSVTSVASGDAYLTDVALYDGHYYVYFGITPEILFFFPVKALTGHTMPTWMAVLICALLFVPGVYAFIKEFTKRYYPNLRNTGIVLLLTTAMITGSGTVYLTSFPTTYSMPAICGLMLLVWGLYFWITRRLVIGSIFMALIAGCRPQTAAALFLALPLFENEIRDGKFFRPRKESVVNTLQVIVPFLLIGGGVLYYNFIRFGSPFDFGYHYLLTMSEVGKQPLTPLRIGIGLFLELLEPLNINGTFPFIHGITWTDAYQSVVYIEPFLGGFFAYNLTGFFSFLIFRRKYRNRAVLIGRMSFLLAILMVVIDVTSAGISQRYLTDFGFFFMLPAVIVFLEIISGAGPKASKRWILVFFGLTVISFVLTFGSVLSDGRYMAMKDTNQAVYDMLCRIFS